MWRDTDTEPDIHIYTEVVVRFAQMYSNKLQFYQRNETAQTTVLAATPSLH